MLRFPLIIVLALVLGSVPVAALQQASSSAEPAVARATAQRADLHPTIDGRGEDPVWATASPVRDFWQMEPDEGADPSQRTAFQVAYNADNLYILVRAFDSHPDSILHALSRWDVRGPSDEISVVVDSYYDRRTGYEFSVNPNGVKRDTALYNDGDRDSS